MTNQTNTRIPPRNYGLRIPHSALRTSGAFTLIELLVVISIIAILAALLLPALAGAKKAAQKKKALLEASSIAQAIHSYEGDYTKFPVSSAALNAATAVAAPMGPEDYTYGTAGVICVGPGGPIIPPGSGFKTPTGLATINSPGNYQTNNAEVMSVLLDVEHWPISPGVNTINLGHAKNPQKTHYLNATMAPDNKSPGVGQDGVYRDIWGNPYIITVDLNYDDKARDAFYRSPTVSGGGVNGLIPRVIGGATVYEANAPVMVWSPGPDRMIDPNVAANVGANKDNIVSWK